MGEHEQRRAGEAERVKRRDAEEDVAHVHHAGIAEHGVEPLLGDGDEPHVEDVPREQEEEQIGPVLRRAGHQRERDAEQAVEAEFLEHTGVQHRGGGGSRGVGLGCPGVEREERDQDAEAEEQAEVNPRGLRDAAGRHRQRLQAGDAEGAGFGGDAEIERQQTDEQNEAAEGEVDGDLPGGGDPVAGTPDADKKEGRDERQFVERVKEEEIQRGERARGPCDDEHQARVVEARIPLQFLRMRRNPHSGQGHNGGEEQHDEAQAVHAEREGQFPARCEENRGGELVKLGAVLVVTENQGEREEQVERGREQRGLLGAEAQKDGDRGNDGDGDEEIEHGYLKKRMK